MNIRINDLVAVSSLVSPVVYGIVISIDGDNYVVKADGKFVKAKKQAITLIHEKNLREKYENNKH